MFPHRNFNKFTCTTPDGKIHNQIDNILIDKRRNSSFLDIRSLKEKTLILAIIWWWQKLGRDWQ
jgi:hypothetical protein